MALAVSYTNESLYRQGCEALRQWFDANEKYRHIGKRCASQTIDSGGGSGEGDASPSPIYSPAEQREIQSRFIEAVRETTARNEFDFELQSGLGVLFNISGEYDKAVDCFQVGREWLRDGTDDLSMFGYDLSHFSKPRILINLIPLTFVCEADLIALLFCPCAISLRFTPLKLTLTELHF